MRRVLGLQRFALTAPFVILDLILESTQCVRLEVAPLNANELRKVLAPAAPSRPYLAVGDGGFGKSLRFVFREERK